MADTHVARVFESAARDHARRLVAAGDLPAEMVVGRWWKDETVEIDVLGLIGDDAGLVGECRWQANPLALRDLADLQRHATHLPESKQFGQRFAFWSRGGGDDALTGRPEVLTFTAADILGAGDPR